MCLRPRVCLFAWAAPSRWPSLPLVAARSCAAGLHPTVAPTSYLYVRVHTPLIVRQSSREHRGLIVSDKARVNTEGQPWVHALVPRRPTHRGSQRTKNADTRRKYEVAPIPKLQLDISTLG